MRPSVSPRSPSLLAKADDVGWAKPAEARSATAGVPTINDSGGHARLRPAGYGALSPPYSSPLSRGMTGLVVALTTVCSLAPTLLAAEIPQNDRRSGTAFMRRETQAMQEDDRANPGMLAVLDGEALWNQAPAGAKACAGCHGDAAASMKGVAARYPAFDEARGRPIDLEQRINACRTDHQQAAPLAWESRELLALTAYVAKQSRGVAISAGTDARSGPFVEAGRELFNRRQGQLDLSCAQCHDDNWGKRLAGSVVPQAHPTGYPEYRLEWQNIGSLQRRLRSCTFGVRAEPLAFGAPEQVDLELYLMWRARGMPLETPAVRP
jgi:L-cysteine S-thiosulfotransferase